MNDFTRGQLLARGFADELEKQAERHAALRRPSQLSEAQLDEALSGKGPHRPTQKGTTLGLLGTIGGAVAGGKRHRALGAVLGGAGGFVGGTALKKAQLKRLLRKKQDSK